jgi:hypothetical protein
MHHASQLLLQGLQLLWRCIECAKIIDNAEPRFFKALPQAVNAIQRTF